MLQIDLILEIFEPPPPHRSDEPAHAISCQWVVRVLATRSTDLPPPQAPHTSAHIVRSIIAGYPMCPLGADDHLNSPSPNETPLGTTPMHTAERLSGALLGPFPSGRPEPVVGIMRSRYERVSIPGTRLV